PRPLSVSFPSRPRMRSAPDVPLSAVLLPLVPTVTVIVTIAVAEPSLTVIVTVAVRTVAAGTAVIVTVRLAPPPPNRMLALGTAAVLDELPLSVNPPTPFASATVRFIVPPDVPHTPPAATTIVGGAFVGVAVGVLLGVGVFVGVLVGVLVGVFVGVAVGGGPTRFKPTTTES